MADARVPELLGDLRAKAEEEILREGVGREQAVKISYRIIKRMAKDWGGSAIYFPQALYWDIDERDLEIYAKFNGHNHRELAREYGMSDQWIYALIKRVREAKIKEAQRDLFEEDNRERQKQN